MNTVNIEKIACNAVGKYITDCRSLVPYIDENDKTPIWDGNIFIYHSEYICNNNLIGRYPLQVKGTEVCSFSDSACFSVRMSDLRKFYQEGGCVFFVVQEIWDDAKEEFLTQIFYNILDRYRISSLLEDYETVDSKTICLHRVPLSKKLFVAEINTALIDKNQLNNSIRVAELDALLNYVYQLNEYFDQIEDNEKRRSIQALVKSLSALKCTSDLNWVDQVFAYMRALIFEAQTCIYEYGVVGLYAVFARFCESARYLHSAEKYYEVALSGSRKYAYSDSETFMPNVAYTLSNLGNLHAATHDYDKAELELKEALGIFQTLSIKYPDAYTSFVALALNNLGDLHCTIRTFDKAEKELCASLSVISELEKKCPGKYIYDRACTLNNLGRLYLYTENYILCIQKLNEALELYQTQNNDGCLDDKLAMVYNNLGNAYCSIKEYQNAEKAYTKSLEVSRRLSVCFPQAYEADIAQVINNMSDVYFQQGEVRKADEYINQAITLYAHLMKETPSAYIMQYIEALRNRAIININEDPDVAFNAIREATDLCRTLYEKAPKHYAELFKRVLQVAVSYYMSMQDYENVKLHIDEGNNVIRKIHELENSI